MTRGVKIVKRDSFQPVETGFSNAPNPAQQSVSIRQAVEAWVAETRESKAEREQLDRRIFFGAELEVV